MNGLMSASPEVRVVRMIWLALTMSIVFYGVLAFVMVHPEVQQPVEAAFSNPMVIGAHVAGLGVFVMAFVLSSLLMRGEVSQPRSGPLTVSPRARLRLIVRWALIEAAAIFGLLSALIGQDPRLFVPLGALAMGGMVMSYPSDDSLMSAA